MEEKGGRMAAFFVGDMQPGANRTGTSAKMRQA